MHAASAALTYSDGAVRSVHADKDVAGSIMPLVALFRQVADQVLASEVNEVTFVVVRPTGRLDTLGDVPMVTTTWVGQA